MFSLWRIKKLWIQTLIETSLYQHPVRVCLPISWELRFVGRTERKEKLLPIYVHSNYFRIGDALSEEYKTNCGTMSRSFNGMTWKMCPNPHRILLIYLTQIIIARIYRINQTKTIFTLYEKLRFPATIINLGMKQKMAISERNEDVESDFSLQVAVSLSKQ